MIVDFGLLDADQTARLDALVAQAKAADDQAQALTPGLLTRGWAWVIGADSSTAAAQTNAVAAHNYYTTMAAKRDRLVADPDASEADVVAFEQSVGTAASPTSNQAVAEAMDLLAPSTALKEIAKPPSLFGLNIPWWALLGGIAAGVILLHGVGSGLARRRK